MDPSIPDARRPWLRLAVMLALFAALTALGVAWAEPSREALADAIRRLAALSTLARVGIGLLALAIIAAEGLRLWAFGWAVGVRIGLRTAVAATIANNFFTWITPSAGLGEPAAVYMMGRRGVPWDAALVIAFAKFVVSLAVILVLCAALLALGFGPPIALWAALPVTVFVAVGAITTVLLVLGALKPELFIKLLRGTERRLAGTRLFNGPRPRRALDRLVQDAEGAVRRLALLRGAGAWAAILGSNILYYAAYAGLLVALAAAFGAEPLADALPLAILYQGFLYVAPTPGASGLAEASAAAFFEPLFPGGEAIVVVLLYRALTAHFHVALGLLYLPLAGGLREILAGRPRRSTT